MRRITIPLRVLLPSAITAFALALLAGMLWVQLDAAREQELVRVEEILRTSASELQHDLDRSARRGDRDEMLDSVACAGHNPLSAGTALIGPDGRVIAATRAAWVDRAATDALPVWLNLTPGAVPTGGQVARDGSTNRIVAVYPIDLDGSGRKDARGRLHVALDASYPIAVARAAVWHRFRLLASGTFAAAALLGVLLNALVSRRVANLLATVECLGNGDLAARPAVGGTDEIGRLATGIRVMADRLASAARELRASEERFRTTFEQAAVGMAHVGPDGYFLRVNPRLAELLGYTPDQTRELRFHDVTHPDDLPRDLAARERLLSGEMTTYQTDKRYVCRDGTHLWANLTLSLHRDAAREPQYFIAVVQDISARKATEVELQRTAELLQAVADSTPDAIFVKDRTGKYLLCNAATAGFVGKTIEDVVGKDDAALFSADSARFLMERDRRVMDGGVPEEEEETVTAAGITRTYLARKAPYRDSNGNVIGIIGIATDVTERKRVQTALRESEERFRVFADHSADALFVQAPGGRILDVNHQACQSLGYSRDELVGRLPSDIDADVTPERAAEMTQRLAAGEMLSFDSQQRRKDGTLLPVEVRIRSFRTKDGWLALAAVRDITERKRTETALRESEQRYRDLVELSPDGIAILHEGAFAYVNRAGAALVGLAPADLLGRPLADWLHPDDSTAARERQQTVERGHSAVAPREFRLRHADGTWRVMESCAGPCRYAGGAAVQLIARDITDRKRAEEALRESEEQLRTLVESATEAIVLLDIDTGTFTAVNRNAELLYGFDRARLCTIGPLELSPALQPDGTPSRDAARARMHSAYAGELQVFEWVHRNASGTEFACEIRLVRFPAAARRLVRGCVTDITERKRAAAFAARQTALLEQMARGSHLNEVLSGIVRLAEDELPDAIASILLLDGDGRLRLGAGPGLPADYNAAIDGLKIGPNVGSCGTAAFERRAVHVSDIATDPSWEPFKELALTHGLRACWSEPIFAAARGSEPPAVLGTFAVYLRAPGAPPARYREVIARAELLASIAIESDRAARALRDSARQFQTVFESVPVGLFVSEVGGRIVMANTLCLKQFGYSHEELLNSPVERLVPEALRTAHAALRERYNAEPAARVMGEGRELYAERNDATLFPVEIGLVPMRIGAKRFVLAAVSDISKRVEAERRTRESEARKAAILNSALDCIISIDHEGRVLDFNPAAEATFRCTAADAVGRVFGDLFVPPTHRDSHRRGMAHFLRTGEGPVLNRRIELPALRADGTEFPSELSITAIQIGARPTFTAHLRDITDRKRAEEELRGLNADLERRVAERTADLSRLVAILDASPDFIAIAADPCAPALYNNAAMLRIGTERGLRPDQLALPAFHPPESVRLLKEIGLPSAARDGVWLGETEVLVAHGAVIPVSQMIQAHKGPDGTVQYFSTIMRDISKLKQLESELLHGRDSLLRANAELSKVSRLKDEFLASMSHELRTPLNGVLALSESLHEGVYGPVNAEQAGALRDIEQSGRHLLALINDILDLSKIEAGQLALEPGPVDVESLCQAAMRLVKEMALKKRHRVTLSIDGRVGSIVADPKRLKQVLVNLLSNAVKFTPDGGAVGLDVTADAAGETVSFAVSDSGIGIRKEDLGLLFQPFQQIDSRLSREFAGTGLGLALVRRMVELHGGGIEVASEPGAGSRFTVTLPFRLPHPTASGADGPPARVRTVLVVEDAPNDALHLERYLEEMNVRVVKLASAEGVPASVRRERPDLVLLDLLLPDGDGWQVLSNLKADPETAAVPVVVVSVVDERARCLALGAADVLLKPINRDTLRHAIHKAGYPLEASRAAPHAAPAPDPTAPLVLVAEDNPLNARAISDYLRALGYRVEVAGNGIQAVEMAEVHRPAVILMDIQMPQLDGLEATRRIRAQAATADTPVVAVTALAMPGDRQRCLDAGATEYLTKPVALSQLRDAITKLLAGHS